MIKANEIKEALLPLFLGSKVSFGLRLRPFSTNCQRPLDWILLESAELLLMGLGEKSIDREYWEDAVGKLKDAVFATAKSRNGKKFAACMKMLIVGLLCRSEPFSRTRVEDFTPYDILLDDKFEHLILKVIWDILTAVEEDDHSEALEIIIEALETLTVKLRRFTRRRKKKRQVDGVGKVKLAAAFLKKAISAMRQGKISNIDDFYKPTAYMVANAIAAGDMELARRIAVIELGEEHARELFEATGLDCGATTSA